MVIKLLIVGLLLYIVFNLFRALFIMLKNDPDAPDMNMFLGKRVKYSVLLLLLILLGVVFGFIQPNPHPF